MANVNAYKFAKNKQVEVPDLTPLRVVGSIERNYRKEMERSHTFLGIHFYHIGGTIIKVDIRKEATLNIKVEQEQSKSRSMYIGRFRRQG